MNETLSQYHDIMTQRFMSVRTGLWNILFTFNGIILAFSGSVDIENIFVRIALIALSTISMLLVVVNYSILQYDTTSWFDLNFNTDEKDKQSKTETVNHNSDNIRKVVNWVQYFILGISAIQLILINIGWTLNWYDS